MLTRRFVKLAAHRSEVLIPRKAADGGEMLPAIRGTAAVFFRSDDAEGTQCQLLPNAFERIERSAFASIQEDDVRALRKP